MKRLLALPVVLAVSCASYFQYDYPTPWPVDDSNLAAFIGSWSVEGDMKAGNAYGAPAGRYTYTEKYDWRPGDFLVRLNRSGNGPGGEFSHDVLLGHSVTTKQYSLIGEWLTGVTVNGTGTTEGNTWTWVTIGSLGEGRYFHQRCAMNVVPRSSYSMRCDTSPDGKAWSTSFEGKATRR